MNSRPLNHHNCFTSKPGRGPPLWTDSSWLSMCAGKVRTRRSAFGRHPWGTKRSWFSSSGCPGLQATSQWAVTEHSSHVLFSGPLYPTVTWMSSPRACWSEVPALRSGGVLSASWSLQGCLQGCLSREHTRIWSLGLPNPHSSSPLLGLSLFSCFCESEESEKEAGMHT